MRNVCCGLDSLGVWSCRAGVREFGDRVCMCVSVSVCVVCTAHRLGVAREECAFAEYVF